MPQSWSFPGVCQRSTRLLRALAGGLALTVGVMAANTHAQFPPTVATTAAALPEPIFWKQNLFLIPYQWNSAADPGAAQAVWLLMSKDRGTTWQKISEAKPQVKAFNYHAEGDGEYWFAIRTLDRNGQLQPPTPYQPELRVIVDTTMPRIETLAAQLRSDGAVQMQWRAGDLNLNSSSWRFEVQLDANGSWQPVPFAGLPVAPLSTPTSANLPGVSEGQTVWQAPSGSLPRALRATVFDRAGNSAAYGAAIESAPVATAINDSAAVPLANTSAFSTQPASVSPGWVSASNIPSAQLPSAESSAAQPWPVGAIASAPYRLSAGAAPAPGDQVTSYGNPLGVGTPLSANAGVTHEPTAPREQVGFGYTATQQPATSDNPGIAIDNSTAGRVIADSQSLANPSFAPVEPYREAAEPFRRAALTRLPPVDGAPVMPIPSWSNQPATSATVNLTARPPVGVEPKRVGSRSFALEYELDEFGRWGIAKVELWGSRDGGKTWRSYVADDDHRSPIVVTVDDAGLYGFRIVVESAGGGVADPPRAGDEPELWVDVDLRQPVAELTAIQPGAGNLADHLIVRWRADDDNLEPRPIALFYSSRPAGPWSAIATNLENSGEYAWQVQRHVPERFYLRLEARDTAGNLAAFQTREPVILASPQPSGRLRSVEPLGPTAVSPAVDYR